MRRPEPDKKVLGENTAKDSQTRITQTAAGGDWPAYGKDGGVTGQLN